MFISTFQNHTENSLEQFSPPPRKLFFCDLRSCKCKDWNDKSCSFKRRITNIKFTHRVVGSSPIPDFKPVASSSDCKQLCVDYDTDFTCLGWRWNSDKKKLENGGFQHWLWILIFVVFRCRLYKSIKRVLNDSTQVRSKMSHNGTCQVEYFKK